MPINEELKRSNYERAARRYLENAGQDPQTADLEAYFDPTLTQHENIDILKEAYPVPSSSYNAKYEREQASKIRLEAMRDEIENKKMEKQREKESRLAMVDEQIRKSKEPGELDLSLTEIEDEMKTAKPGLFDMLHGKYNDLKGKYAEHQEISMKEREFRARQRAKSYSREQRVRALEAAGGPTAQSRIMAGLSGFAQHKGGSFGGEGILAQSLRGKSGQPAGISLLTQKSSGGLYGMLTGNVSGMNGAKPRNKYVTVIEKGIARRVKVPVEGQQQGMAQQPRGALEQHIYGTSDKSPLFGMTGGNNQKSPGLSGLLTSRPGKSMFSQGNKSGLSRLSLGGGKSSFSRQGKKKSVWRV